MNKLEYEKLKFSVMGMSCGACSSRVQQAVSKIKGIKDVSVNLLESFMTLNYSTTVFNSENEAIDVIISAVKNAGYQAECQNQTEIKNNSFTKENTKDEQAELLKKRFLLSAVFLLPLMYISMHGMLPFEQPNFIKMIFDGAENALIFAFSQMLFSLPILFLNRDFFVSGFKNLFRLRPNMNSLVAMGSAVSFLYGLFVFFKMLYAAGRGDFGTLSEGAKNIYFESSATILTLITFGKWLEAKSKGRTRDAVSKLVDLSPKTAILETPTGEKIVPAESIKVSDVIIVKSGASIAVDGEVIFGSATVDESALTGESVPVFKELGAKVFAASINKNGFIKVRATTDGKNTSFARIIELVQEASSSKAPIAKIADTVALYFVPIVIFLALVTFFVHLFMGKDFSFALSCAISVLVISCPCALGLATPVAIMVGTGKGAENGILIKSGEAMQKLCKATTLVLDKTGTVTQGKPIVTDVFMLNESYKKDDFLEIAYNLEKPSGHPLADSVVSFCKDQNALQELAVENYNIVGGKGVFAQINGKLFYAGNVSLFENVPQNVLQKLDEFSMEAKTPLLFAQKKDDGSFDFISIIAVRDCLRDDSLEAVNSFLNMNLEVIMLTGDNKKTANIIANQAGISSVISDVLPHQKEKVIQELQEKGKNVVMVGDGINDAPSLMRADTGIAIGGGTDVAIESADVILVRNSLLDAASAIKLSKAVIKNIKQNLFWAFLYNSACIPLAAGLFYSSFGIKLNPMIGALAMGLSSVCVVSNALRLKTLKLNKKINQNKIIQKENKMRSVEIVIDGMACSHCSGRVESALNALDGVQAKVDLEKKTAFVNVSGDTTDDVLKETVTNAGYKVISIK